LIEKNPISPVSVVVFNMPSKTLEVVGELKFSREEALMEAC
jgi:hypothetical protein